MTLIEGLATITLLKQEATASRLSTH